MKNVYQEYYKNERTKNLKIERYAYYPPPGKRFVLEGRELILQDFHTHEALDFRTVERYQEYMDCGFTILFGGHTSSYMPKGTWENSEAKIMLDLAHEAGIKKVIIADLAFIDMDLDEGGIIGEGKRFFTEADLDAFVKERMSPYVNHPSFYGVQLRDEPRHTMLKAYGQLYRSIKRVYPNVFIQCNMMGCYFGFAKTMYPPYDETGEFIGRYKLYLEKFLDETGADYVMMDQYDLFDDPATGVYRYHFRVYQLMAQIAKERGVKLMTITQAYKRYIQGRLSERKPTEDEMYWQVNGLLGFGIKELAYYTYWTWTDMSSVYNTGPDSGMITMYGEKTPLYYAVQKVNAMIEKLAPVILNFEHENDTYAVNDVCVSKPLHLEYTLRGQLKHAKLSTNQELAMAFEMYDKHNDQYLYVLQNNHYCKSS